jgi:hypothetical protein
MPERDEREWTLKSLPMEGGSVVYAEPEIGDEPVVVVPRARLDAALVEAEARERERLDELHAEASAARGARDRTIERLQARVAEPEGLAASGPTIDHLRAALRREAALRGALRDAEELFLKVMIVDTAIDNPDSATTLRYAREYAGKGEELCRAALAEVGEAEPDGRTDDG